MGATKARGLSLVVYLSMGFGNPYGEPWSPDDTAGGGFRGCGEMGVRDIVLADTVGTATPVRLESVLEAVGEPRGLWASTSTRARRVGREGLEKALSHGICWFEGALGGAVAAAPSRATNSSAICLPRRFCPGSRRGGSRLEVDLASLPELAARARSLQTAFS